MSIYQFSCNSIGGEPVYLDAYRGQVLLVVNTASRCGFTPQYRGLEILHRAYSKRGFSVLGFPCDQFHQEFDSDEQIQQFCLSNYEITFPLFARTKVAGANAVSLFKYLSSTCPGWLGISRIKWNFTKFLVDRQGTPVRRFATTTYPNQMRGHIEKILATKEF